MGAAARLVIVAPIGCANPPTEPSVTRMIVALQHRTEAYVIGPAEIEEMMAEFAEATLADARENTPPAWPCFVDDLHIDGVDRELNGLFLRSHSASLPER